MFSRHHRKARLLFGLSDVLLTALAFEAAYQTRLLLPIGRLFYLTVPIKALLLGSVDPDLAADRLLAGVVRPARLRAPVASSCETRFGNVSLGSIVVILLDSSLDWISAGPSC